MEFIETGDHPVLEELSEKAQKAVIGGQERTPEESMDLRTDEAETADRAPYIQTISGILSEESLPSRIVEYAVYNNELATKETPA